LPVFGGVFVGYLVGGLAIDYKFLSVVGTVLYTCAGRLFGSLGGESGASDVVLQEIPDNIIPKPPLPNVLKQPTSQAD
jgi:hypothetical protein